MGKVLESKGMGGEEKGHGRDKEGAKWRGGHGECKEETGKGQGKGNDGAWKGQWGK